MSNGTAAAGAPGGAADGSDAASYLSILPMNCVLNVVRPEINAVLGDSGAGRVKLSNEARQCFLDCATELVMFVTQEASDRCAVGDRRTLSGADIVTAVEALGFGAHYAAIARMALSRATSDAPLARPPPLHVLPSLPQQQQQQSQNKGDPPAPGAPPGAPPAAPEAPSSTS